MRLCLWNCAQNPAAASNIPPVLQRLLQETVVFRGRGKILSVLQSTSRRSTSVPTTDSNTPFFEDPHTQFPIRTETTGDRGGLRINSPWPQHSRVSPARHFSSDSAVLTSV
jgi:hypothetical protein